MLLIIFGTKVKTEVVGEGEFFCPSCQRQRKYQRKKQKNYFSVYFIPLFPIQEGGGEIVECQQCGRSYSPEVLKRKLSTPQPDVARLLNSVKSRLQNGYPVEYMIRDLTDDGIDLEVARNITDMATGKGQRQCTHCALTYAGEVSTCSSCNRAL